ncbi:DUF3365 domain-containing protein [Leptolyngbya sp. FACHB-261]|uniref:c-type heme family protein n=1 Tax=Leptolyngbya sp. FACHB-261 TaxID=2692806 RepID=UPI0016892E42|nr:DUF3365 domain-containing protein [Leptolyngbya sp. FACHB-261]MBD2101789.1 DUF3365 domain-containing protein [Leptolyngbya sp. FACHB-261]
MLKNIKLGTRFNLILALVFMLGITISGAALSSVLQQRAQAEVTSQALLLIQAMNSVRSYTSNHIKPLLAPQLEPETTFTAETVPAYSATEVFENLRQSEDYKNFFYKEATLNPTNLRDKADDFESKLVERFRSEPNTPEISGFRALPGGQMFYIARPLAVSQKSCLQCHSKPEVAPKSLVETYGAENGFGWQLNEIVATQVISVPADDVLASANRSLSLIMSILIGIFAVVILLINLLLRRSVIWRIRRMAKVAQEVSTGKTSTDFEQDCGDEIGALGIAFNRMKSSLEIAMRLLSQQQDG